MRWPIVLIDSRHVRLPEIIEIVEDTRVLDVLAGVDDRAGRRANAGRGLMIGECHALRFQEFSCGNRKWPFWKKVFLVNEDEQDVVGRRGGAYRRSNSGPGGDGERRVHAKQRRGALLRATRGRDGPRRGWSSDISGLI